MALLECSPNNFVGVTIKWIEIVPQSTYKQDGVLRDDGEPGTQVMQSQSGNIDTINADAARIQFENSEETQSKRRFA